MEKEQPRDKFFSRNIENREKIKENREKLADIKDVFEEAGFGFGGWDERTTDMMSLALFSLLIDKKIFTREELKTKVKEIKEVSEAR